MKVAIIGSGAAGLAAAHALHAQVDLTLFEADAYFGGHAHTVDVTLPGVDGPVTHGVDTGFLVFNHRTYPHMLAAFDQLGVVCAASDMSFSVQVPGARGAELEWGGADLGTVFAQRRNLLRPRFWSMLADLMRFNRQCTALAQSGDEAALSMPLEDFLDANGYGEALREWYLLPMLGCIWSCPTEQMLRFPVATMIRFCHNHGLLQVNDRPQWYTVAGGSRRYVERITARVRDKRLNTPVRALRREGQGVRVVTAHGAEWFDHVVLATHPDQALRVLGDAASDRERRVLGAVHYQANRAVLHTDTAVLPQRRTVWSAWNFEAQADGRSRVCLHYLINRLQPLPFTQPVLVSLNPVRPLDPSKILGEYDYAHPVFDQAAIAAQAQLPALQGQQRTWYAGAWTGYGFHEDAWVSGLRVAGELLQRMNHKSHAPGALPEAA